MYLIFGLIGAIIGGLKAKKHKGSTADIAQYAAGFGIAFLLLGLFVTIIADRTII